MVEKLSSLFQRTIRGPQYYYQGHDQKKKAFVAEHAPFDYETLKNNGKIRNL